MAYDANLDATFNPSVGGTPTAAYLDLVNANFAHLGGAWTSYTPTYTNLTLGNGTVVAAYLQVGKTVRYRGSLTLGSSTSIAGGFLVSLPVAPKGSTSMIGLGRAVDASASFARTVGLCEINSAVWGTAINFASTGVSSWSASVPIAWTTSDTLDWYIEYEAA